MRDMAWRNGIMDKNNKIYNSVMAILLIVFLFGIFFLSIITPDKEFSESENRKLAALPKYSTKSLLKGNFTSDFEKYISDQIVARDFWVNLKADSEKVMGKKDNNGVYLGDDGYLFQMVEKPDKKDIENKVNAINSFSNKNKNLKKYFMLVPNSVKVLEDKLPKFADPPNQLEYIGEVKNKLDDDIKFVDVYDTLYKAKDEYIFYKTDHHWTSKGAYYAYEKLAEDMGLTPHKEDYFDIKKVTDDFYGSLYSKSGFRNLSPDSIELYTPASKNKESWNVQYYDKNISSKSIYNMDNLKKKDKYTVFLDGNHSLVKITTNNNTKDKRKIVIVRDSFANSIIPFLTGHFSEIYVVDLRYFTDSLDELIKDNNIDDCLILYSANTFFEDSSVDRIGW
jgi:hypothetical protein